MDRVEEALFLWLWLGSVSPWAPRPHRLVPTVHAQGQEGHAQPLQRCFSVLDSGHRSLNMEFMGLLDSGFSPGSEGWGRNIRIGFLLGQRPRSQQGLQQDSRAEGPGWAEVPAAGPRAPWKCASHPLGDTRVSARHTLQLRGLPGIVTGRNYRALCFTS